MANSWFQFKQFKINQSKTAMKVGTDGVLLGAWADVSGVKQILDIGTGTGLLALMLAQRQTNARVHAIEIEPLAAEQAEENISDSQWTNRIEVFNDSIQNYTSKCLVFYDLIVSNPPYFSNSFVSSSKPKQLARHNDTLSPEELIASVTQLLSEKGTFAVVLPSNDAERFVKLCQEKGLFLKRILKVFPKNNVPEKRRLMAFSFTHYDSVKEEKLIIEPEQRHQYSDFYKELTKEYYLSDDKIS